MARYKSKKIKQRFLEMPSWLVNSMKDVRKILQCSAIESTADSKYPILKQDLAPKYVKIMIWQPIMAKITEYKHNY